MTTDFHNFNSVYTTTSIDGLRFLFWNLLCRRSSVALGNCSSYDKLRIPFYLEP